jgi:hypothetical protein
MRSESSSSRRLDKAGRDNKCTDKQRETGAEEHQTERVQREQGSKRRSLHAAGARHDAPGGEMLAPRLGWDDVRDHGRSGRMQHAFEPDAATGEGAMYK